jgi:hypothetical protein
LRLVIKFAQGDTGNRQAAEPTLPFVKHLRYSFWLVGLKGTAAAIAKIGRAASTEMPVGF